MKTVAGIDLGTQSMKVVLYDYETRKSLESSSCPMELISESDGTREQKTEWYKKGLEVCFSKISSEGKKSIQAIGVSGQQHGSSSDCTHHVVSAARRNSRALWNSKPVSSFL